MKKFKDYFNSVPSLETDRFLLVPFSRDDMDEYFDILRDNRVQKYLGGGVPLFDKEPKITNWLNNINGRLLKRKLVFTWCVKSKTIPYPADCRTGRALGIGQFYLAGKKIIEISYKSVIMEESICVKSYSCLAVGYWKSSSAI